MGRRVDNRARLRDLMKQAGLTQRETADLLGVHITTVQRWLANPALTSSRAVTRRDLMALEAAVKSR